MKEERKTSFGDALVGLVFVPLCFEEGGKHPEYLYVDILII